jgi:hypothetical protein
MDRRVPKAAVLASAVVLVATTGASPAVAAPATPHPAQRNAGNIAVVTAPSQGQCTRPTAKRTGGWVCPDSPAAPGKKTTTRTGSSPEFCNIAGCYIRYNDFKADFASSSGTWGYGGKVLGRLDYYVMWQLAGRNTRSKPVQYRNSVDTHDVLFTGDLFNAAPGKDGTQVRGKAAPYPVGKVPGGLTRRWQPNGYNSNDGTMWDHTQVHQFSWKFGDYRGHWYAWVKSICTHTKDKKIYRFRDSDQLPAHPYGGGYHP